MAIIISLGKLTFKKFITENMVENNFKMLPIDFSHINKTESLLFHQGDPFDRIPVVQTMSEKMPIISADTTLEAGLYHME